MNVIPIREQPPSWEFFGADDIFMKQMYLPKAGLVVPQHAHEYDHYTLLAHGRLRVMVDDKWRDYTAPATILIKAKTKHTMISLVPETVAYCIHNLHGKEEVAIHEEHALCLGE